MEVVDELGKIRIMKNGKEVECDILFTFDNDELQKQYVGYTDHSVTKDGRKMIYVNSINPLSKDKVLEDITDPRELEMVQDVLKQIAGE